MENFEEFLWAYIREKQIRVDTDIYILSKRFEKLGEKYQMGNDAILKALYNFPLLINAHPIIIDKKFEFLNKSFNITNKEFGKMIERYPHFLNFSNSELSEQIYKMKDALNLSDQEIKAFLIKTPFLLGQDIKIIENKLNFLSILAIDRSIIIKNPEIFIPSSKEIARKIAMCDFFGLHIDKFINSKAFLVREKRLFARASIMSSHEISILTLSKENFECKTKILEDILLASFPISKNFEEFYHKHYEKKLHDFETKLKEIAETKAQSEVLDEAKTENEII